MFVISDSTTRNYCRNPLIFLLLYNPFYKKPNPLCQFRVNPNKQALYQHGSTLLSINTQLLHVKIISKSLTVNHNICSMLWFINILFIFYFVNFRMANARAKAEQADQSAIKAEQDSDHARIKAKEYAPEFHQPGI